ncbi:TPA: hypothetical protein ACKP0L_002493, partial [Pseudomonas putida]
HRPNWRFYRGKPTYQRLQGVDPLLAHAWTQKRLLARFGGFWCCRLPAGSMKSGRMGNIFWSFFDQSGAMERIA